MNNRNDPEKSRARYQRRFGLGARLRGYLVAGVLVTAPVGITLYLAWLVITLIDDLVDWLLPGDLGLDGIIPFTLPGLGVVIVLVGLVLIGALTTNVMGRFLHNMMDRLLNRMPVIRSLYAGVKQVVETVFADRSNAFRECVLVEYPRKDAWAIGFITGRTEGEVQNITDDTVVNVFVPTTPNPTSGYLLFVPRRDIHVLSMTVEEGLKMVISGGIVVPPDRRSPQQKAEGVAAGIDASSSA